MNSATLNRAVLNPPPATLGAPPPPPPTGIPDLRVALVAYLGADPALAALVAARIHPGHLPQSTAFSAPAVVYQVVSHPHSQHLDGGSGVATARVQLDAYAPRLADAVATAEALRRLLQGLRGPMAGLEVLYVVHLNRFDAYESPADASDQGKFRVSDDYSIEHRVSIPVR